MIALATVSAPHGSPAGRAGWWSNWLAVADDAEVQEMFIAYLSHSASVWDESPDKDAEFAQTEPSNYIINN